MILKEFYTQKKTALLAEFSSAPSIAASVHLYSDKVFKNTIANPIVMFKYDTVNWETSSEKNYKADVSFCCYIVLPISNESSLDSYELAFTIANRIDKAILHSTPDATLIDTNSTFKIQEKQWTNDSEYWDKNDFFIWKITYKTTLVENSLKKKYKLIRNGATDDEIQRLGYSLTDVVAGTVSGDLYLNSTSLQQSESSILTDSDLDNDTIPDADDLDVNIPGTDNREIKNVKIN